MEGIRETILQVLPIVYLVFLCLAGIYMKDAALKKHRKHLFNLFVLIALTLVWYGLPKHYYRLLIFIILFLVIYSVLIYRRFKEDKKIMDELIVIDGVYIFVTLIMISVIVFRL